MCNLVRIMIQLEDYRIDDSQMNKWTDWWNPIISLFLYFAKAWFVDTCISRGRYRTYIIIIISRGRYRIYIIIIRIMKDFQSCTDIYNICIMKDFRSCTDMTGIDWKLVGDHRSRFFIKQVQIKIGSDENSPTIKSEI